jgi:hypothetical protein
MDSMAFRVYESVRIRYSNSSVLNDYAKAGIGVILVRSCISEHFVYIEWLI